jgi:hypothetical protein
LTEPVAWLQRNALHAYNNRNSKGISWTAWWEKSAENFVFSDGYNFVNASFGCSTAVSAAFNAPLSDNPILKDAFTTIEAEHFNYLKGVFVQRTDDTTAIVLPNADGDFSVYNHVDFGDGKVSGIEVRVQINRTAGRSLEIYADSLTGPLLATLSVPSGNGWITLKGNVAPIAGRHTLFLVYRGGSFPVDYFYFTKPLSGMPTVAPALEIYPNPASGFVWIRSPRSGRLTVHDVSGKTVFFKKIPAGTMGIDIGQYAAGLYVVNIDTESGPLSAKFRKQ